MAVRGVVECDDGSISLVIADNIRFTDGLAKKILEEGNYEE